MIQRIITALVIVVLVVPPLLLGGYWLMALVALIMVVGGVELFQLTPNYKRMPPIFYIGIMLVCASLLFVPRKFYFTVIALSAILILAFPIFFKKLTSRDSFIIAIVFILFYSFASSFVTIHSLNEMYVWYIILATYACDTGAYFAGYFFGKHKLCERISPKKTIEGAIGGYIFSLLISFTFAWFVLKDAPMALLLIASLGMPIVSQLGDLAFSSIKRNYNIKDFSNIFPGHGGFMDRLDSLVYNLIFFYAILIIFV